MIGTHCTKVWKNGEHQPLDTLILTFDLPKIPDTILAGCLHLSVCPFLLSPMHFSKHQWHGHGQSFCSGRPVCSCDGRTEPSPDPCQTPPSCIKYKGSHPASLRDCLICYQKLQIQEVCVLHSLPFQEPLKRQLPPVVLFTPWAPHRTPGSSGVEYQMTVEEASAGAEERMTPSLGLSQGSTKEVDPSLAP